MRTLEDIERDYDIEAVQQNGLALEYVEEQTPEICLEAVKQNRDALQYVAESLENRKNFCRAGGKNE